MMNRKPSFLEYGAAHGIRLAGAVLLLGSLGACDFLDPTRVDNPQTTSEDLANARRPTEALLPGLRAQFARALRAVVTTSETTSDNYSIQSTGLSKEVDDPYLIIPSVGMINTTGDSGAYWNLQELRALSDFVLEQIAPTDETATPEQVAEAHLYRGFAFLMQGENFSALPVEENGEPVASSELLQMAVADFDQVLQLAAGSSHALQAQGALARAHRMLGNSAQAVAAANAALSADSEFVFTREYDANTLVNGPFLYLVDRATQEMQVLPRLDFLDPKYTSASAGIPYLKAEEMHLILAEARLAGGDNDAAGDHLADAIELANSRPVVDFSDVQPKNQNLTVRPSSSEILVQADATSPFRAGLVKDRPGTISVPTISATSLDADSVASLTTQPALAHALFLARQEILFLEGRRLSDLGIRLPISVREIDASPVITDDSPGTRTQIPAWIPRNGEMDIFTPASPYSDPDQGDELTTTEVTILHDMNRLLAENFQLASPLAN